MKDYALLLPILFIFHDMEEIIGFRYFFGNNKQLFERFPKITAVYKDFSTEGFALAVYEGEVVEVYRIFAWYSALDEIRKTVPFDPNIERGRIIFTGEVAEEQIRKKYIGRNVSKLFKRGEASPVKTFYTD